MKRLFNILFVAFALFAMASCAKDEIGGTATEKLAGQWYVQADAVDSDGKVISEDPYGAGRFRVLTYNTSENTTTDLFVDDLKNFWNFKVKTKCDRSTMTFSVDKGTNLKYESEVTIVGGKIVINGTKSPSGQPADYIEMLVRFSDDENAPAQYEYLKLSGWRYTGFANDN